MTVILIEESYYDVMVQEYVSFRFSEPLDEDPSKDRSSHARLRLLLIFEMFAVGVGRLLVGNCITGEII